MALLHIIINKLLNYQLWRTIPAETGNGTPQLLTCVNQSSFLSYLCFNLCPSQSRSCPLSGKWTSRSWPGRTSCSADTESGCRILSNRPRTDVLWDRINELIRRIDRLIRREFRSDCPTWWRRLLEKNGSYFKVQIALQRWNTAPHLGKVFVKLSGGEYAVSEKFPSRRGGRHWCLCNLSNHSYSLHAA